MPGFSTDPNNKIPLVLDAGHRTKPSVCQTCALAYPKFESGSPSRKNLPRGDGRVEQPGPSVLGAGGIASQIWR